MPRPLLAALAALAVTCVTIATAEAFDEYRRNDPDHLIPINPYPIQVISKYKSLAYDLLKLKESESFDADPPVDPYKPFIRRVVSMVRMPAFKPEECIVLKENGTRDRREYILIHTRASRNIAYSMPENNADDEAESKGKNPPKKEPVDVVRATRSLDSARAARILILWERMLMGVRYPSGGPGTVEDADIYEFRYPQERQYGEAHTPLLGSTGCLVDLGDAMIAVCESPVEDREKNLALLDKACDVLEKQLEAQKSSSKKEGATAVP